MKKSEHLTENSEETKTNPRNQERVSLSTSVWGGTVRLNTQLWTPVASIKPPKFNKSIQPMEVVSADGIRRFKSGNK